MKYTLLFIDTNSIKKLSPCVSTMDAPGTKTRSLQQVWQMIDIQPNAVCLYLISKHR